MYKGSTNQKTGESMEKPGKKLKKFLIITGTTGLVYAGLKYLLPLVAPFFIGYTLALSQSSDGISGRVVPGSVLKKENICFMNIIFPKAHTRSVQRKYKSKNR